MLNHIETNYTQLPLDLVIQTTQQADFEKKKINQIHKFVPFSHSHTLTTLSPEHTLLSFHGFVTTQSEQDIQVCSRISCQTKQILLQNSFQKFDVVNFTADKTDFWKLSKASQRAWSLPFLHAICTRHFLNIFKCLTISNALNTMKQISISITANAMSLYHYLDVANKPCTSTFDKSFFSFCVASKPSSGIIYFKLKYILALSLDLTVFCDTICDAFHVEVSWCLFR